MNKLYFKDINGNVFSLEKLVGFIKDENEGEPHYLVLLDGVGTIEVEKSLFNELVGMVFILDKAEDSEGE